MMKNFWLGSPTVKRIMFSSKTIKSSLTKYSLNPRKKNALVFMNVYLNLAFYFALTIIFNFSENQVMHVLCWKLAEKRDFREYGVMLDECGTILSEL